MSSSANSVDTDSSSLSRQSNKRPYTPDSPPPPALDHNKRPRVSLDSSATDDRVQLPPIHSLRDHHHLSDSRRASLPTLYSENPARLSKSYPATNGPAPVRSPYHHHSSLTSYQFPPSADQEDKYRPRVDTSFNPYTSYSNSSPNSSFPPSYNNFASPLSPPSQAGPQSANGYLSSTHSWSAPSPHLTRPSSNPETDRHPTSKSEEHLDSWAFPQYAQSNSLTNGSKHSAPVSSLPAPAAAMAERPKGKRGKLPKPVTDYLKDWLHRHSDHPYPSEDEKKQLCQATGLSMSQVSNWMINVCIPPAPFCS